ncbi:hypothetical protein GH714_030848 [Hevea brasiliensis]|uniref:Uncharacterized protein n=1 Tax=Hevea brasiliensis TaxID=3981 RepID=A0A6A6LWK7_HEVBR|nr:hypothetical protein GH714_030848 [Hevea brasiliensis]
MTMIFADWPSVPPIPDNLIAGILTYFVCVDNLIAEGGDPEEEILLALDVPPGRMGQVFIVGPVKQVRKAEAMLRGTMLEMF